MTLGKLKIPYFHHLHSELSELQRRFDARGFKVFAKKDGDGVKSDDCTDSLAGACYMAINRSQVKLPTGRLIEMPLDSSSSMPWRGMQGQIYGYGTGQQVARSMEQRIPGYRNRR